MTGGGEDRSRGQGQETMRRLLLSTALVLGGCAHLEPKAPVAARSARAEDIWVHDGRRARHAIVEPERSAEGRVVRVIWSDPAPRPERELERELRWAVSYTHLTLPTNREV